MKYTGDEFAVKVPEGITKINESAFWGADELDNVYLPGTIQTIEFDRRSDYKKYKTIPDWTMCTIGKLSGEIARLIKRNWLPQMTARTWALLSLTQQSKAFQSLFKEYMKGDPNEYLTEMIKLSAESGESEIFLNAAYYAAEHREELESSIVEELYSLVKNRKELETAREVLDSVLNPREIDLNSPYAWLYKAFDEFKLKKYYRDCGGVESALNGVLAADGKGYAPQIAVLAAVVPYLELYDEDRQVKSTDTKVRLLPDSDRAAAMLRRASLINFIKINSDVKSVTEWIYPFCRYASEEEIEEWIRDIENSTGGARTGRNKCVIFSNALLLSDFYTPRLKLNEGKRFIRRINKYAEMRGITEDIALTDVGLDEFGKITYDLGDKSITAFLTDDFKLKLTNEKTGEALEEFPEKEGCAGFKSYKKAKTDFKRKSRYLEQAVKIRTDRLFKDFLYGKSYDFDEWKRTEFATAINKKLAELLVWEQGGRCFTVKDGKLILNSGEEFVPKNATVRLAHPMELSPEEIDEWRQYFKNESIQQPFVQTYEPVVNLKSIKKDRYLGVKIPLGNFVSKREHGIYTDFSRLELQDCEIKYTFYARGWITDENDKVEVYKFVPVKYGRQANHIVALLDKWSAAERIKKDDMSVVNLISGATAEELAEYTEIAIKSNAQNLTAKLLEMKKERSSEWDATEEFSLGEW